MRAEAHQLGLPDPRFTSQDERRAVAAAHAVQRVVEQSAFARPPREGRRPAYTHVSENGAHDRALQTFETAIQSMDNRRLRRLGVTANVVWAPPRNSLYVVAPMWRAGLGCDPTNVTVRCLIVDDSVRFLEVATARLGKSGLDVVGTARTSDEALDKVERLRPHVVLVDISLGDESGLDLAGRLAERPDPPVIALISTRAEEDYAALIAASPAVGFIPKSRLSADAVRELAGP
jgi:CheY-like chemotaxis protein